MHPLAGGIWPWLAVGSAGRKCNQLTIQIDADDEFVEPRIDTDAALPYFKYLQLKREIPHPPPKSSRENNMPGQKRDCRGKPRANEAPTVRNEFTPMFEYFRDELDAHHDRRERIIKASRDVTALSKKM